MVPQKHQQEVISVAYFFVTTSVRDGEYEYWHYSAVEADNQEHAAELGMSSNKEWTREDYREVECEGVREIPKEDYDVLKRYL